MTNRHKILIIAANQRIYDTISESDVLQYIISIIWEMRYNICMGDYLVQH